MGHGVRESVGVECGVESAGVEYPPKFISLILFCICCRAFLHSSESTVY